MDTAEHEVHLAGTVVAGHGVASGRGPDAPYPGGSLRLQRPIFASLGLDLRGCFTGTINVSTSPRRVIFSNPMHRFEAVTWTDRHPPENFSFVRCDVLHAGARVTGWGYRPDAGTKAEHFQKPEVVEVIAPWIDGLAVGAAVVLAFRASEVAVVQPEG